MNKLQAHMTLPRFQGDPARISILSGDIVTQDTDAIAGTLPKSLAIKSKLTQDILNAAGDQLDAFILDTVFKPRAGTAFAAPGFGLKARAVLFAITPDWRTEFDRKDKDLIQCYRALTTLAGDMGFRSIAFPALITGHKGFPLPRAARLSLQGILETMPPTIEEIRIVCYNPQAYAVYQDRLSLLLSRP